MTKAEACLWKYALRAGIMKGYTFNRQRPVGNYIADFVCKELKLVIEVDGCSHNLEETKKKDKLKESYLKEEEFRILRFDDNEVLKDIGNVIRVIEDEIDNIVLPLPPPEGDKTETSPPEGDKLLQPLQKDNEQFQNIHQPIPLRRGRIKNNQ
jgi:very-short-patch-repair endonuclease